MILNNKVINFLGDSITLGYGTSYTDNRFSSLIEKRCGLKRANNYGIGGTRIARQKNRIAPYDNQDFCVRCMEMDKEADIIVVMVGSMIMPMEMHPSVCPPTEHLILFTELVII